jgi:hypothetical protein
MIVFGCVCDGCDVRMDGLQAADDRIKLDGTNTVPKGSIIFAPIGK